jgi:hypothetical protein
VWRFLLGGLFVAHGLVHTAVWATPTKEGGMPFDPKRSWALSALGLGPSARSLAVALALLATAAFVAVGIGVWAGQGWWRPLAVASAAGSFALMALYFHPWLSVGVLLDVAIFAALVWTAWPPPSAVGS